MKKKVLYSIIIFLFISCSASELSFKKIKAEFSKQTSSSFSINTSENALSGTESQIYNEIRISLCERRYSDKEKDCDDWYNSSDMYNLYNEIIHNEKISYGFGSDINITKINTNYILDYVVLGMFDMEDIRFERFIILFDNKKSIIFKLEYLNSLDDIKYEMKKNNYLDCLSEGDTDFYFWKENVNKSQIVKELRAKKFNCNSLQTLFDKTESIKEIIYFILSCTREKK